MVPFGKDLFSRVKGLGKDKAVYMHSLEYIALQLPSIIVNELYEENPTVFPPSPTHLTLGDNMPSLSWFGHHSTASAMGQNQIQLSAEY
jgi:predicted lipase